MVSETRALLMVDPSLLLSSPGLAWLEDDNSAHRSIIVSATFREWINDRQGYDFSDFVPQGGAFDVPDLRRVRRAIDDVATFSHDSAQLPDESDEVRRALLDAGRPAERVLADEWTFLQSQSWMVARYRYALDKFRDAGGLIVEVGHRLGDAMIASVVKAPNVPEVITVGFTAKVGAKWLVVGGSAGAGTLGSLLLGPGGAFAGAITGTVASRIACAIDP